MARWHVGTLARLIFGLFYVLQALWKSHFYEKPLFFQKYVVTLHHSMTESL